MPVAATVPAPLVRGDFRAALAFGLLLFVMQGVAPPGTRFGEICVAALPFMGCALLLAVLIVAFPGLALWLPWLGG